MKDDVKALLENMSPEELDKLAREGRADAWRKWYEKPENRERKARYNRMYAAARALRARMQEGEKS